MNNYDDPCRDIEQPPGPQRGAQVPPNTSTPPSASVPLFPRLESQFEGDPISRSCVMIPRNLYYAPRETSRRAGEETQSEYNIDNPFPPKKQDAFRYCSGKVYNLQYQDGVNYIHNPIQDFNDHVGAIIDVQVDQTHFYAREGVNPEWSSFKNTVTAKVSPASLQPIGESPRAVDPDWAKKHIPNQARIHEDTAFRAPASFFAKEASLLNIRLPELTDIQVYVPNQMTYEEQMMDYESVYGTGSRLATKKESVYRRFARDYNDRSSRFYEFSCEDTRVQKFPSDQVEMVNNITKLATENNFEQANSSFYRTFQRDFSIYTRIQFDTNHPSPIANFMREENMDSTFLGFLDADSPSKVKMYSQILDEKIENFVGSVMNDGETIGYYPNSYDDLFFRMNQMCIAAGGNEDFPNAEDIARLKAKFVVAMDPDTYPLSYTREDMRAPAEDGVEDFAYIWTLVSEAGFAENKIHDYLTEEDKDRTFRKIFQNKLSHSEVVAYRVEKTKTLTGEVVQEFYFFNNPDVDRIDFLDSQIIFGERYTYKIYCINAVVGVEYNYATGEDYEDVVLGAGLDENNNGVLVARFDVEQRRKLTFVETPYHQQDLLILDAPPVPPDVWFLPYQTYGDSPREMLWFWFSPGMGEREEAPIQILNEDAEIIERMKLTQNVPTHGRQMVTYRSDSEPVEYEMLVLDEPPRSYRDFSSARVDRVSIEVSNLLKRMELNKDYYITFRARDYAGISNPTAIFKYRLSDYNGIYHELEEYFIEPQPAIDGIPFDRALNIRVAGEQSYINFEGADQYGNLTNNVREGASTSRGTNGLSLGPADPSESLWGRRICFEIESTVSGRRIRLCVDYDQSRVTETGETESINTYLESMGLGRISILDYMRANRVDICSADAASDYGNRSQNSRRLTDLEVSKIEAVSSAAGIVRLSAEERSRSVEEGPRRPTPIPPRPPGSY